mgnify:CR=1 FL=1|jgi:hypothetical protein|nr:MAG TPA: AAA ATPase [Bacteriophage sp.]
MEENLKERVEIHINSDKRYTIDLSDKKVIVFTGDNYFLTNLIPQFIMDFRSGNKSYVDKALTLKLDYYLPGKDLKEESIGDATYKFPLDEMENAGIGLTRSKLSGVTYYSFFRDIEYGRSPYQQIRYLRNLLENWSWWKEDPDRVLISTHSPYVLNYMNVIMAKDQEFAKKISAYYVDEDLVQCLDSTCNETNRVLLDTIELSKPMEYIWKLYDEIKV